MKKFVIFDQKFQNMGSLGDKLLVMFDQKLKQETKNKNKNKKKKTKQNKKKTKQKQKQKQKKTNQTF